MDSLKFQDLFFKAIDRLPKAISGDNISVTSDGSKLRHSIPGLHDTVNGPAENHKDQPEEIIVGNLFAAIYSTLHSIELFVHTIRPEDLRLGAVRYEFERRIRGAIQDSSLGWTEADRELAKRYFAENQDSNDPVYRNGELVWRK